MAFVSEFDELNCQTICIIERFRQFVMLAVETLGLLESWVDMRPFPSVGLKKAIEISPYHITVISFSQFKLDAALVAFPMRYMPSLHHDSGRAALSV
jgi:hypothetical protein